MAYDEYGNEQSGWQSFLGDFGGPIAGAAGLLLGGGNKDPYTGTISNLNKSYDTSADLAKSLQGQSQEMLTPASQYIKALISGDRQALLQATQPERRKVIDQYSAAKKSIGEFAPRGGGQSTAMANLASNQAADLSGITAGARAGAVGEGLKTGLAESQQGIYSQQVGNQALSGVLQGLKQEQQQKSDTGSAWGKILGGVLTGLSFL